MVVMMVGRVMMMVVVVVVMDMVVCVKRVRNNREMWEAKRGVTKQI